MNLLHQIHSAVATATLSLHTLVGADVTTQFNNWDTIQNVGFTATGAGTTEIGEFWGLTGDSQLKITSDTTANFTGFAKTANLLPSDEFLTALATGTSLVFDYRSFAANNTLTGVPSFRFRLVVNTDANSLGYANAASPIISIDGAATTNASGAMVWNYNTNQTFLAALNAYRAGTSGSFFEFVIDNTGFPGMPTPTVFSIDKFRVITEPLVVPSVSIFNNWDETQVKPFSVAGGGSVEVGEFWSLAGNSQFRITSTNTPNFTGLAKTDGLSRDSEFLAALVTGKSINFDYKSFAVNNVID